MPLHNPCYVIAEKQKSHRILMYIRIDHGFCNPYITAELTSLEGAQPLTGQVQ